MRKLLLLPIILLASGSLALAGPIRDRIYQPPKAQNTAATLPPTASLIEVQTADGLTLRGIAVPARPGKPTLLVFHGNASIATNNIAWLQPLATAGFGILAAEYRGYGGNAGSPSETALAADADAFYAEARRRAGDAPLIVVGHSLGGGVAFGLAARQRLDALITVGTFTGIRALAPRIVRALITDRFDNAAIVPTLDEPFFLAHGLADDVIPAAHGNTLHNLATRAGRTGGSFVIPRAGHQPDGATMLKIIEAVATRIAGGTPPDAAPAIRYVPFG